MKAYFLLTIAAVLMAFGSGYYTLYMQSSGFASPPDVESVVRVKKAILMRLSPVAIIDLENIYGQHKQKTLIEPSQSILENRSKRSNLSHFPERRKCIRSASDFLKLDKKEQLWVSYRCGWLRKLSPQFFSRAPFMSSNGYSYAYLAMMSGISKYKRARWVFDHLKYFHVLELPRIKSETEYLPGIFAYLVSLKSDAFKFLLENENLIMSDDLFLVRAGIDGYTFGSHYRVYLRRHLETLLQPTDYQITKYEVDQKCSLREAGICWGYSAKHVHRRATESSQIFFIGSILLTGLVVLMLLGKIRTQRREDDTRRLVLRVLSHELRTPISSMLMQIDQFQRGESKLSESDQEAFLRLSADVYRLQRLTEKSRKYLSFQKGQGLINLENEEITSISDYFLNLLDSYTGKVQVSPPLEDFSFRIDGYWLGICSKNLIENALIHGKKPIEVSWKKTGKYLEFSVKDAGKLEVEDVDQLTTAFYKREDSPGSGLGLHLVKTISTEMGGEFKVTLHPTTFCIRWKERKA